MGPLGASWGRLGPSWGAFAPFRPFGGRLGGLSRPPWGSLGAPIGPSWGAFWAVLGASLGRLGALLGRLGALLGASEAFLGPFWRVPGLLLACQRRERRESQNLSKTIGKSMILASGGGLGGSSGDPNAASWGLVGSLGAILGRPEAVLRLPWAALEPS